MSLGKELSDDFKNKYKTATPSPHGEVKLFRILIDSFKSLTSYGIAEIHGRKAIVQYVEDRGWFTKTPRCELGDIFFLVYSPTRAKAKYFVMQNKVQHKSSCTQIHANLVQHELLATKKFFEFTKTHATSDMFSHARHDSVCVYGNFYESSVGMMDEMSVFTASKLEFVGSIPSGVTGINPTKEVEYTGLMDNVASMRTAHTSGVLKDFDGTDNLEKFGDLVEELYIGEPIGSVGLRNIVAMLKTLLRKKYYHNLGKPLDEFCEELDNMAALPEMAKRDVNQYDNEEEIDFLMMGCKRIVFINCDKRNE